MKIKGIVLMGMLLSLSLTSCSKDELAPTVTDPFSGCEVTNKISGWTLALPIDNSGEEKVILNHTEALRRMARTGAIDQLRAELCNYDVESVKILETGHQSDINEIGFAPQLRVEHYVIAMYHPVHYKDHFIIYNIDTKQWWRYEEGISNSSGQPEIYTQGTGD